MTYTRKTNSVQRVDNRLALLIGHTKRNNRVAQQQIIALTVTEAQALLDMIRIMQYKLSKQNDKAKTI